MKGLIRMLFFSSLLYGGWKKFESATRAENVSIVVSEGSQLSESARAKIKVHIQSFLKKALPLDQMSYLLHQAFPHLAHVVVRKDPFKKMNVAISVSNPLALCNESVIVCANDQIVPKEIFSAAAIEALPRYQVADVQLQDGASLKEFKQFVACCDPTLHRQYHIAWKTPEEIHLHDREHSALSLIINSQQASQTTRLNLAYTHIRQSLLEKKAQKNKKQQLLAWNVDGRFKNQMIVIPKGVMG